MASKIGLRLKEERERIGLSQAEFAERVGVHRNTQVRYESGKREPDADYLTRAGDVPGLDYGYIVSGVRTTPDSVYRLAVACVIPGLAQRMGLSADALIDIIDLAAEEESRVWGDQERDSATSLGTALKELEDALFEDGELLAQVFEGVAKAMHGRQLGLAANKRAQTVMMLYRTFRGSGKVDARMIQEAVALAGA